MTGLSILVETLCIVDLMYSCQSNKSIHTFCLSSILVTWTIMVCPWPGTCEQNDNKCKNIIIIIVIHFHDNNNISTTPWFWVSPVWCQSVNHTIVGMTNYVDTLLLYFLQEWWPSGLRFLATYDVIHISLGHISAQLRILCISCHLFICTFHFIWHFWRPWSLLHFSQHIICIYSICWLQIIN